MTYLPPPPPPGQPGSGEPDPQHGGYGQQPQQPPQQPDPYGQPPQHDPYGQQPTQAFPAYPQQPPQYPGYTDPNAEPAYGAPGYGQQPPGYPPVPPVPGQPYGQPPGRGGSSAKTWIIIGVIVAVAALAGGLAWAFSGNDTKKPSAQDTGLGTPTSSVAPTTVAPTGFPSTSGPTGVPTETPTQVPTEVPSQIPTSADSALAYLTATRLALAFEEHSLPQLKEVACPTSTISLTQDQLDTVQSSNVEDMPQVSGDVAYVKVSVTHNDGNVENLRVKERKEQGNWCVASF